MRAADGSMKAAAANTTTTVAQGMASECRRRGAFR
jgi:hypothetical protein